MTYEDQYKQEMKFKGIFINPDEDTSRFLNFHYGKWLENKLTIEHRRRVAAEARFKAAEKAHEENLCGIISEYNRALNDWQQSIVDYNKIIKEAGENE